MKLHGKALAAALALLLCAALVLPACSAKPKSPLDPEKPTNIQIWHYYNGPQKEAFDALVTEFNETVGREQGIVAESLSQGNVNDLISRVLDAANKKVGAAEIPDIFSAYADTAYQVDQLGLVAALDPYLTEGELAEYLPGYLAEGRFDSEGNLKIFPIAKSTEVMMLNKTDWDRFAASTGASLDALATMEGVVETARQYTVWSDSLTPVPGDGKAFFGRDAMANYFIIGSRQLGVEIFQVQDGKLTLQCDPAIFRRLWDCFYLPYLEGAFGAYGRFRSDDAKTGDLIALVCSTSGAAYFPAEVTVNDAESYPIEAIALPAPGFAGGQRVAVQQGAGMVVIKSTPARETASVIFLKWFTEAQRNIDFSIESGYLPVKAAANDKVLLQKSLEALPPSDVTHNLSLSLPVAADTTTSCELYTSKAFANGTEARHVLETSLMNQLEADREAFLKALAEGVPREQALAPYLTDEQFETWFAALERELSAAVQSAD